MRGCRSCSIASTEVGGIPLSCDRQPPTRRGRALRLVAAQQPSLRVCPVRAGGIAPRGKIRAGQRPPPSPLAHPAGEASARPRGRWGCEGGLFNLFDTVLWKQTTTTRHRGQPARRQAQTRTVWAGRGQSAPGSRCGPRGPASLRPLAPTTLPSGVARDAQPRWHRGLGLLRRGGDGGGGGGDGGDGVALEVLGEVLRERPLQRPLELLEQNRAHGRVNGGCLWPEDGV